MPIKTLGGMFSEPKKTCRRNFVRENVHSVGQLQYLVKGVSSMPRSKTSSDIFMQDIQGINCQRSNDMCNRSSIQNMKTNCSKKKNAKPITPKQTFSDRSVQTLENNGDYSASVHVRNLELDDISLQMAIDDLKIRDSCTSGKSSKPEHSDIQSNTNSTEKIGDSGPNSKSANKDNLDITKVTNKNDIEQEEYIDPSCPPGYRLLPESERKHTLKTLQQQYFERISELNSLSIRSDTLRIQQKKIEIEKDLKRIDAGLQTFDRPKVFIKKC